MLLMHLKYIFDKCCQAVFKYISCRRYTYINTLKLFTRFLFDKCCYTVTNLAVDADNCGCLTKKIFYCDNTEYAASKLIGVYICVNFILLAICYAYDEGYLYMCAIYRVHIIHINISMHRIHELFDKCRQANSIWSKLYFV